MTRLYLVRHGHAHWERDEARPLSNQGRLDALRVAELLDSSDIVCIYSSPARRAIEIVEPLAGRRRLQVVLLSDLRERDLPVQAPREFETAVRASWRQPEAAVGGGESNSLAQVRALSALYYILSRHKVGTFAAATHGNLLAILMNGLGSSYGFEFWRRMTFPDVYELRFQDAVLSSVRRLWTEAAQQGVEADEA